MTYLVDTSALYPLITMPEKGSRILDNAAILDLTMYELGNVIWKEYRLGRISSYETVISKVTNIVKLLTVVRIDPRDLPGIEELAIKLGLTFYDASYVYYAKKLGYVLLTNDAKILAKAGDIALSVREVLK